MYSLIKKNEFHINKNKNRIFIKKLSKLNLFFQYFFFFVSYYLYYLSLEKCMSGRVICALKIKWIQKKIIQSFVSSIILGILAEFIFLKLISKFHLLHCFLFFFIVYNYSHGEDFYDHGLYNFSGCIIIIISIIILLSPFNIILYLKKKKKYKIILIYLLILIVFSFIIKYLIIEYLICNDWNRGLNNTYIENNINKYGCNIKIPKFCPYKLGSYFLDISKLSNIKCGNDSKSRNKFLIFSNSTYINYNTSRFGFPLVNRVSKPLNCSNENIKLFTKINLIDMDNEVQLKEIGKNNFPEIIVDFTDNPNGKMIINLRFNESLSKERLENEKKTNPYSKNIIILYFDSVSRSSSLRQLKKTTKFFENFISYKGNYNPEYPSQNFHSFQFFKYISFYNNTLGNYLKIFYGKDNSSHMIRITKYLKENGYITAFSNDLCLRDSCYMAHAMDKEEICDHEFLLCDPNMKNENSMIKRCLYDKLNIEYQYEYGFQFWEKYKYNRKFLAIVNNDGHEGTLELLKYDDEIIFNFLNKLFKKNMLKETTILLLSDHGCPMPSLYHFSEFFKLEKYLPMLFILTYDKKNNSYNDQYKNIQKNQQILITSYDIFNTIGFLIYGEYYSKIKNKSFNIKTPKSKYGKNLFSEIKAKRSSYNFENMPKNIC